MGTLALAGSNFADIATACHLVGPYYALPPFGNAPMEGPPKYEEMQVTYPGVDGIGVKRFGFRGRDIFVDMCFKDTTKDGCETLKNAFFALVTPLASFSITLPGGTARAKCRMISGTPTGWHTFGDHQVLTVSFQFLQFRES